MASSNKLTTESKTIQTLLTYYSPSSVVPPTNIPLGTTYCLLSSVDPWADDNNPPAPDTSVKGQKTFFKNVFAAKLINSNDISPVLQRIDWTYGTTYDTYRDDIDITQKNSDGTIVYYFYVKNKYDQVFKCLWNGANPSNPSGIPATDEPYFQPGSYGNNNIYKGSDGYKWKYMYTIDVGLKVKFMDKNWMPVPAGSNIPNPDTRLTSAGLGDIEVLNVYNGGSGYDPANSAINILVSGDGFGATGTVGTSEVNNGVITDVIVTPTQAGNTYSFATVSVSSARGNGAIVYANTSPVGGHGFDPVSELGCTHVMFTATFTEDMSGQLPTDITYHQIGILINPSTYSTSPIPANGQFYNATTSYIVAPGKGSYVSGETVFQSSAPTKTLDTSFFSAKVVSFNAGTNVLEAINITGTPITNAPLYADTTKTTRSLLSVRSPNFIAGSGYLIYMENRSGITRSADSIEQFKAVLGY